jgi:aspartate racemase
MVACTEFSLIADAVDASAVSFDTLDRLASGIIAFATESEANDNKADAKPPGKGATTPQSQPNKETTP